MFHHLEKGKTDNWLAATMFQTKSSESVPFHNLPFSRLSSNHCSREASASCRPRQGQGHEKKVPARVLIGLSICQSRCILDAALNAATNDERQICYGYLGQRVGRQKYNIIKNLQQVTLDRAWPPLGRE
jgi:hypothetical protein